MSSISAGVPRTSAATRLNTPSLAFTASSAPSPVTASMRRIPAAIPPSDVMRKRPMSPVRCTCVPPQSSVEKLPNDSTRTTSSYFSPNSAMAPDFTASSKGSCRITAGALRRISPLTSRSTVSSSAGVTGWVCEKSKRSRSGATSEPRCTTCLPSAWRSAACSKCVAEWFSTVAWRVFSSTLAVSLSPILSEPDSRRPMCRCASPSFFVSVTVKRAILLSNTPTSPTCPPASA